MRVFSSLCIILGFLTISKLSDAQTVIGTSGESTIENIEAYHEGTIIFKVKDQYRSLCFIDGIEHTELSSLLDWLNTGEVKKMFPFHSPPETKYNEFGQAYSDLSLIYRLRYYSDVSLEKAAFLLMQTGLFEYADPRTYSHPLYIPDDPLLGSQFYLSSIRAYDAWDITKGDTNVVIGISDTGTDLFHPDLSGNIKYNYNDPINGIDSDNDGYIDNFMGWDLGENNNIPQVNYYGHGAHVSGISSASVDNNTGIAGVGFRCKFLPIKVDDAQGKFVKDYESIVYAADRGCHIINCSWGSRLFPGHFAQDIIDYATINRNVLVVAAAGNSNNEIPFYPATLRYVISVGGTDSNDVKWLGSSYGHYVDVCAPSTFIHSTWTGNNYVTSHGTSMAAPMVSGGAALVKSRFPHLNAIQIGEQLRVSADPIDTMAANSNFLNKLGAGRINLGRAVDTIASPSVRLDMYTVRTVSNPSSVYDTLEIDMKFINYLAPTQNLSIELISQSIYAQVINPVMNAGVLNTLDTINTLSSPFRIVVFPNMPVNFIMYFRLEYSDGTYSAFEYFKYVFRSKWIDLNVNDISTSITSDSRFGFNDNLRSMGQGFSYKNARNMIYTGGLLVGVSNSRVSNNIIGDSGWDNDFTYSHPITPLAVSPPEFDTAFFVKFNDHNSGPLSLNIEVSQTVLAATNTPDRGYLILEYLINNTGFSSLSNLYAGIYADWDIRYSWKNRSDYIASQKLAYAYATNGNHYAGVSLLSRTPANIYAFDSDGSYGSINLYDGFSSFEKYAALTTSRPKAGYDNPEGNDIAHLLSSGPFTLQPSDTLKLVFALVAGENLVMLSQNARAAHDRYYQLAATEKKISTTGNFSLLSNPAREKAYIRSGRDVHGKLNISLFNSQSVEVWQASYSKSAAGEIISIPLETLTAGVYFIRISGDYGAETLRLMLIK